MSFRPNSNNRTIMYFKIRMKIFSFFFKYKKRYFIMLREHTVMTLAHDKEETRALTALSPRFCRSSNRTKPDN